MAWALERWLAPYIQGDDPSATSATSDSAEHPPIKRKVADVAVVAPPACQPTTDLWTDAEEEPAAIVEYDGGAPRAWAEALARLDPSKPPGDVPVRRWLRYIDDCGHFLDGGWADKAASFGWGPLDLFGCDQERPFARVDHLGMLWLLNGGTMVELHRDRAILETASGARHTYRRRPVEVGRVVLAWEIRR